MCLRPSGGGDGRGRIFFDIPGARNYAMAALQVGNARRLESTAARARDADVPPRVDRCLELIVVGGGPTGVETSGGTVRVIEIAIRRDGWHLDPTTVRIVCDVAPRLLTPSRYRQVYAKRCSGEKASTGVRTFGG